MLASVGPVLLTGVLVVSVLQPDPEFAAGSEHGSEFSRGFDLDRLLLVDDLFGFCRVDVSPSGEVGDAPTASG